MGRRSVLLVLVGLLMAVSFGAAPALAAVRPGEDVFEFGDAGFHGSTRGVPLNAPLISVAGTRSGRGYWLLSEDGGVFSFGDAQFHGSTGGRRLNQPVVSLAADPQGRGYWFVASDGGIFSFDVPFFGSMGGRPLNQPVVGMAATNTGSGYWLVAGDGGIFSFGDARFAGSTGGRRLNQPIVGMAADPDGSGYWFVAADGGVFAFDAAFHGSAADHLSPGDRVVGMAAGARGGYWLVSQRGAVFSFGGAPFAGAASDAGRHIVGMASTPSGSGYWLAARRALARDTPLTVRGIGPVVAGMTVREAERAAGVGFVIEGFEDFERRCYHAHVAGLDFSFLVLSPTEDAVGHPGEGIIGRVSSYGPSSNRLENGLGVGSTEGEVYGAYPGRVSTEGHAYDEGGHYLTVHDGQFGVRFETDGSRVDTAHVGDVEAITYVEGCA